MAGQWKVESSSTSELMLQFHRGLIGGLGKAEALRQARLSLLHTDKYEVLISSGLLFLLYVFSAII